MKKDVSLGMEKQNKSKGNKKSKSYPPYDYDRLDPTLLVQEPTATYVTLSRKGLTRSDFEQLQEMSALDLDTLSQLLGITPRTIQRKLPNETFRQETSERMLELFRLYAVGQSTFGSLDVFRKWLRSTIPALANATPLSFLDTGFGIRMIQDELDRISYGVFS